LAVRLADIRGEALVVVGIPRGGVAAEVAGALGAPLDVVVVRKIGAPGRPEYAIGALAEGDVSVISDEAVRGVDWARSTSTWWWRVLGASTPVQVSSGARRTMQNRCARIAASSARP